VFIVARVQLIVYGLLNILYALPNGEVVLVVVVAVVGFILIGGIKNSTDVVVHISLWDVRE